MSPAIAGKAMLPIVFQIAKIEVEETFVIVKDQEIRISRYLEKNCQTFV